MSETRLSCHVVIMTHTDVCSICNKHCAPHLNSPMIISICVIPTGTWIDVCNKCISLSGHDGFKSISNAVRIYNEVMNNMDPVQYIKLVISGMNG